MGVGCASAYFIIKQKTASADSKRWKFESGHTLNPKYDKRWKKGEDAFLTRDNFLCVLDGVGGWIEVMIDSGIMTKEFIGHIAQLVDNHGMSGDITNEGEVPLS